MVNNNGLGLNMQRISKRFSGKFILNNADMNMSANDSHQTGTVIDLSVIKAS